MAFESSTDETLHDLPRNSIDSVGVSGNRLGHGHGFSSSMFSSLLVDTAQQQQQHNKTKLIKNEDIISIQRHYLLLRIVVTARMNMKRWFVYMGSGRPHDYKLLNLGDVW
ncbi:hypothetical protein HanRHA438_Chr12g0566661 [Helianthus annuus]|nr:hypothetical protein HanRHA438_Chr12g0566661 [Helianthus annuus]